MRKRMKSENKRTWNFQGRQQKDERVRKRAKEQRARCEKRKEHEWSYWARRKNNNTHAEWNEMEESKSIRMELEKRNVCKMQSCRRHNDGNVIGAEKFGNNKQSSTRYFTFLSLARLRARNMHFICCCGIAIKRRKLEIMLKMHLPHL